MDTIIRWAGSKRLLLPELLRYSCRPKSRYIEPFAGSACLFFALEPPRAFLSDLNRDLIGTYREIRRDAGLVLEAFGRFPRGRDAYYHIRQIDPCSLAPSEAAARFLYLNRYCFNGIYRTNSQGHFNVPYGPPKKPLRLFNERVRQAAHQLRNVELFQGDFSEVLQTVSAGDFVYLDPPYVMEERRVFSQYLPGSFSRSDLNRLSNCLVDIDRRGGIFLVSYENSPEARQLASGWASRTVRVRRNIAGFSGARRAAEELIISNGELQ